MLTLLLIVLMICAGITYNSHVFISVLLFAASILFAIVWIYMFIIVNTAKSRQKQERIIRRLEEKSQEIIKKVENENLQFEQVLELTDEFRLIQIGMKERKGDLRMLAILHWLLYFC